MAGHWKGRSLGYRVGYWFLGPVLLLVALVFAVLVLGAFGRVLLDAAGVR